MDSRFKAAGSSSSSVFIVMYWSRPACLIMLDVIWTMVIPNSWRTIDEFNNRLYVRRTAFDAGAPIDTDTLFTLTETSVLLQVYEMIYYVHELQHVAAFLLLHIIKYY